MTTEEIQLGDIVRSKYTGFTGVAVAKIVYINKCIQFEVAPRVTKANTKSEGEFIDIQSLIIVKKAKREKPKEKPKGGSSRNSVGMKGY